MILKENNIEIVKNFSLLKNEVFKNLDNTLKDKTYIQNYLYFIVAPVFNYTEAIIILCKEEKFNAAQPLLRSLFETHINIQYYINGDDVEKKLAISAKTQFDWNKTVVNAFVELIRKYENLESPSFNSIYNSDFLDQTLAHTNRERDAIIKGNNLIGKDIKETPIICPKCNSCTNNKKYTSKEDRDPSTLQKAILCDSYKIEETEPGHFESMYHLVYRQLSSYTHLDLPGVTSFITIDNEGNYSFKDRADQDSLISNSVNICIELVKDLFKYKVINGTEPDLINIIKKLISTGAQGPSK